jgi:moderate conductance mechanosensitive channel
MENFIQSLRDVLIPIWDPRFLRVALIIVGLLIFRVMVQTSVKRLVLRAKKQKKETGKRLQTLAVMLRSLINVSLLGLGVTWILSELGINLGPILAAAGVLGLAIGFGAQNLVKDVLNGFFLILEGQISVGDWITTNNGNSGEVEEISLRTIILRDLEGNVHIIPHGEITTVTNMTKNWSQALIEIGVAYREDADHVIRILKEEADNLRNDKDVGEFILEPAEVHGITQFADSAIVYRLRIKTETGQQWAVTRMYNLYIKRRFDEEGIEIPFPHVTLYMGEDKKGESPPLRVIKMENPENEKVSNV